MRQSYVSNALLNRMSRIRYRVGSYLYHVAPSTGYRGVFEVGRAESRAETILCGL